ncbi:MAG: glycoside hydrolase family 2 TIM barrel-domain containing protein, partial [Bacteroidota bacterium]
MLKQASFLLLIFFFSQIHLLAQSRLGFAKNPRQKISLNQGWKFHLGDPDATFYELKTDDSNWEKIHVPHTLELTSLNLDDSPDTKLQETFQRKVGWYRRDIQVADSERKVFLEFEGAHQVTTLWVNGEKVGVHDIGGYTPFHFDITKVVKKGQKNQITLLVDNRKYDHVPPDPGPFDYIKFSGLYRDVYQVETNAVRLPFNWEYLEAGVTFTTPSVDPVNGNATISIKTSLVNEDLAAKELTLVHRLIDKNGEVVLRLSETQTVASGAKGTFNVVNGIEDNLHLWSTENPYLYRLNTMIYEGDQILDGVECKVGIRKFEHHPREGFLLNGKPIKLIGMNRHQHYFFIGDAMPNALHYKDMLQFKELGFNVLRTAHYPHDNAIMEACDELGILVYEEAPTWIDIGGDAWFDNLDKAARRMVRNHRNHPSIVIWGGGINHRGYVPRLHYAVKQEDPTRLTASQSSRWTG